MLLYYSPRSSSFVRQFGRLFRVRLSRSRLQPTLAATTSRALSTAIPVIESQQRRVLPDPCHYTTGRWLNQDKLHREARYVKFDFEAPCSKAVDVCTGAEKVIRYEKREGGFNRVFILHLDNGARVVARVPYRIAGPQRLTTNSEVATMSYVRSFTKIPVPKVLDWSDDKTCIGTEYIIQEYAPGVRLHEKWPSMSHLEHARCVRYVTEMMAEMANLPFPVYRCLYFADAPIGPSLKTHVTKGYCIGPHCGTNYWDCTPRETRFYEERPPNRGPCKGVLIPIIRDRSAKVDEPEAKPLHHGLVHEHLRLLEISENPIIKSVASPMLLHHDLYKRNICVAEDDPSCITATIDWQFTSIEPAFTYSMLRLVLEKNSAVSLRNDLIYLSRGWTALGLPGSCPYQPTPEELAKHTEELEEFEVMEQLNLILRRMLDSDSEGWIPADEWDEKRKENSKLFVAWLDTNQEHGASGDRARVTWPFGEVDTFDEKNVFVEEMK
ncbi:kinase-like domain-containing protein [Phaeosphaeriaceae sp. PMI808]|nr:kinase-like domain-containing protein [Phaeosphaeriaceae sp. PMI808]